MLRADSRLNSILRAYALAYVSVTGPRLFGLLRSFHRKDLTFEEKVQLVRDVLFVSNRCLVF